MGALPRVTLRVKPPVPFGDITMVPAPLSDRSEAEMARAIAAALAADEPPATAADAYGAVRRAFPFAPPSARLSALAMLMEKMRRPIH